jgi:hypothetical protein
MPACKRCGGDGARREGWYCSADCRLATAREKELARAKTRHAGKVCECTVCGSLFEPEYGTKKRSFCSDTCDALGARAHKGNSRRSSRARRYGVLTEPVRREEVYARDAWTCGLCGTPIDPALAWPHPKSATMDHVVPLSRGGAHTYLNVQAAHLMCNSAKGSALPGELRLAG